MAHNNSEQMHSACDECRWRKLKCSGELPVCKRCQDEAIKCIYSPRKKMGRPRKRKKSDEENEPIDELETDGQVFLDNNLNSTFPVATDWELSLTNDTQNGIYQQNPWIDLNFDFGSIQDPLLDPSLSTSAFIPNNYTIHEPSLGCLPHPSAHTTPSLHSINTPLSSSASTDGCSCLDSSNNILSSMRTLTTFTFPLSVGRLRNAITHLYAMLRCTHCPRERGTCMQNVQLLNATLISVADRFYLLISALNTEAARLEATGETKELKVGDPSQMGHHTGRPDCPAGLIIHVGAAQWREMSASAMRKLLKGPDESLIGILEEYRERQERWHQDPEMERLRRGLDGRQDNVGGDGHHPGGCLFNLAIVKKQVDLLQI